MVPDRMGRINPCLRLDLLVVLTYGELRDLIDANLNSRGLLTFLRIELRIEDDLKVNKIIKVCN